MEAADRHATKDELLQIAAAMSAEAMKQLDAPKPGESPILVFEDHSRLQFIARPGGGMVCHCVNVFMHGDKRGE